MSIEALRTARKYAELCRETGLSLGTRRYLWQGFKDEGLALIVDQPDHYVTFDADGWFIEHSVACRVAGTIGTCEYNVAIRRTAEAPPEDEWGRWRITNIDEEGLPSLVRVGEEGVRSDGD